MMATALERMATVRTTGRLMQYRLASCSWPIPIVPQVQHYRSRTPVSSSISRRRYATEALSLPESVNLNVPPPSAPTVQSAHPESAHGAATSIDECLASIYRSLEAIARSSKAARVPSVLELYEQMGERAGRVLEEELPYEDTPDRTRRVKTHRHNTPAEAAGPPQNTWLETCQKALRRLREPSAAVVPAEAGIDDGLVLLAHVIQAEQQEVIVSWSLGFIVETRGGKQHIVSCSHTLESVSRCSSYPYSARI